MKNRRIGMIPISFCLVEDDPGLISSCFRGIDFVPLQVTTNHANQRFEYVGISHKFPEISEGYEVPEYGIKCSQVDDKEPEYEVVIK